MMRQFLKKLKEIFKEMLNPPKEYIEIETEKEAIGQLKIIEYVKEEKNEFVTKD